MTKSFKDTILEEAVSWIDNNQQVALVTVVQTWGSSPFQIGSKMIINEKGNFFGSISGGCVESNVITECIELIKSENSHKKIEFKVSDESAWSVGLACGGEITVFIEKMN
tara:strand:- start:3043 stop:3372 length:330 start_codon:yes stop_codon:yes gene_type:complete